MTAPSGRVHEDVQTDPSWRVFHVRGKVFDVPAEYRLTHFIGEGAFGTVCAADHPGRDPPRVAVKRIEIQHDNILEVRRLVRELYLLDHFEHDNVVGLLDLWPLRVPNKFNELYLTQELMDADLHNIIRSKQPLTPQHIKFLLYQIMRGLKAIHSAGVLHRDLKPSNILINSNCDLKLADFGLARETAESSALTLYVATRWYRAPELLMQYDMYDAAVDMWAAGCIFGEMMKRKPLLMGANYLDQLALIVNLLGKPPREDCIGIPKALEYVQNKLPESKGVDFHVLFAEEDPLAIDLIQNLLQFNPRRRLTAAEALRHPYFEGLHDPNDEPDAPPFLHKMPTDLSMADLKQMIFDKMCRYHRECASMWSPEEDVDMLRGMAAEAEEAA